MGSSSGLAEMGPRPLAHLVVFPRRLRALPPEDLVNKRIAPGDGGENKAVTHQQPHPPANATHGGRLGKIRNEEQGIIREACEHFGDLCCGQ